MQVSQTTFRVFLVVLLIVSIIIIIQASWSLWFANTVVGDSCECSGVDSSEINSKKVLDIILLLIGIALFIYTAVVLLATPGTLGQAQKPTTNTTNTTTVTPPAEPKKVNIIPDYSDQSERFVRSRSQQI